MSDEARQLAKEIPIVSGRITSTPQWFSLLPVLVFMAAFFGFIAYAVLQPEAKFYVRTGGERIAVSATIARLGFAPFVGLGLCFVVTGCWALWQSLRGRYALTSKAFLRLEPGRKIALPLSAVEKVRVESDIGGWLFTFVATPTFTEVLDTANTGKLIPALRKLNITVEAGDDVPQGWGALGPGEFVRWRGRQGISGVHSAALGLPLLLIPILIFARIGMSIVEGNEPLTAKLGMFVVLGGFMLCLGLGPTLAFVKFFPDVVARLLDVTIITDRRIVWQRFSSGHIVREIDRNRILEAVLIRETWRGGWISLTLRDENDPTNVVDFNMHGIRHPRQALSAIENLIR